MALYMALVILAYMLGMYRNRAANITILLLSAVVFSAAHYLLRSQRTVDDVAWMKTMIPHHSIAILTSERAWIDDPRVCTLADQIIETQQREIAEMQALISDLQWP